MKHHIRYPKKTGSPMSSKSWKPKPSTIINLTDLVGFRGNLCLSWGIRSNIASHFNLDFKTYAVKLPQDESLVLSLLDQTMWPGKSTEVAVSKKKDAWWCRSRISYGFIILCVGTPPWKLTWNLKISHLQKKNNLPIPNLQFVGANAQVMARTSWWCHHGNPHRR